MFRNIRRDETYLSLWRNPDALYNIIRLYLERKKQIFEFQKSKVSLLLLYYININFVTRNLNEKMKLKTSIVA